MGAAPDPALTRHYYIAAEPCIWDFAPEGEDPVCGKAFPAPLVANRASWKTRYILYTDASFSKRVLSPERLGILGPVLRGTTGQYLAITFLNRCAEPLSMHPHGVKYDKESEGSYYKPSPGRGAAIGAGAKFTYVWHMDAASGPSADEPSSKAWLYHSHVVGDEEINMGLIGFIIVTDPSRARPDGTPADVDREMGALFKIFDENFSESSLYDEDDPPILPANPIPANPAAPTWAEKTQLLEEGQRYAINGRVFGNLHGFEANEGERVRWYLFGLGSENDFHTAHWHGMRIVEGPERRAGDVVELLPATMKLADMVADNPGSWLFHCHIGEHMKEGMFARFVVKAKGAARAGNPAEPPFFGMPDAMDTLRILSAEFGPDRADPTVSALHLHGQVSVPDPLQAAGSDFIAHIGARPFVAHPDNAGIGASDDGVVLVKNIRRDGTVKGGVLEFDLTLKGAQWVTALRDEGLLRGDAPAPEAVVRIAIEVAGATHMASNPLKAASREGGQ